MRKDARSLARTLDGTNDVEQVGVVALPGRGRTERLEAIEGVVGQIEAVTPALVRERWIGDDVVEDLERAVFLELRIGQRIALLDERRGVVVQNHVHPGQGARGCILLLPVQRYS